MSIEKFLGVLAVDEPDSRIEMVQVSDGDSTPTLELRLQRKCCGLGWRTHRRMRMAAGQVSDMHAALNLMDMDARDASISATDKAAARSIQLVPADERTRQSG